MCGRYSITATPSQIAQRFKTKPPSLELAPRYNAAPTQELPIVIADDGRQLVAYRWGLVPHWADDLSIGNRMINARAETIAQKPAFRQAFQQRRCLVPADGFYEWQACEKPKIPHRIQRGDSDLFAFAGIYERWRSPEGALVGSFAIITTTPNALMAPIHDRMPVILPAAAEALWLDPDADPLDLHELLLPFADEAAMTAFAISTKINRPTNNDPSVITPL